MSVLYMAYYVKKVTTASVSISVNDLQTSILEDHFLVCVKILRLILKQMYFFNKCKTKFYKWLDLVDCWLFSFDISKHCKRCFFEID